jgi:HAE1 family hydrophobic/amphiphilic exporter-1
MLAASTLAILIVPVLFVIVTRLSYGKKELAYLQAHHEELMERARKIEKQKIDPELEYEMTHHFDRSEAGGQDSGGA